MNNIFDGPAYDAGSVDQLPFDFGPAYAGLGAPRRTSADLPSTVLDDDERISYMLEHVRAGDQRFELHVRIDRCTRAILGFAVRPVTIAA